MVEKILVSAVSLLILATCAAGGIVKAVKDECEDRCEVSLVDHTPFNSYKYFAGPVIDGRYSGMSTINSKPQYVTLLTFYRRKWTFKDRTTKEDYYRDGLV